MIEEGYNDEALRQAMTAPHEQSESGKHESDVVEMNQIASRDTHN